MRAFTKVFLFLLVIGFSLPVPLKAQEAAEYDPLKRNLVFVESDADVTIPVNMFKLRFGFDIQKATFAEAEEESARVIKAVSDAVAKLGLPNVEIIKGWDILTQAKISVGMTGRKIENRLTVKVSDFPNDKMHELIAKIVDLSLGVNKDIYFEEIEVGVTDSVETGTRETLIMDALRKLKANAEKAAETQGSKVIASKRIFVMDENAPAARMASGDMMYAAAPEMMRKSFVSVQKGFTVQAQVTDHIKMTAKASGIYEIQ